MYQLTPIFCQILIVDSFGKKRRINLLKIIAMKTNTFSTMNQSGDWKIRENLRIQHTNGFHIFPINEIIRCEAESNYTMFFLTEKRHFCASKTLKEFEEILIEHGFIRTHKSHFVNRLHIREFLFEGMMKMSDDSFVEVARRRKREVLLVI